MWNKKKVVERVDLSFSPQPNSSNILIEGHGMNKHGLFEISGVGDLNGEDSTMKSSSARHISCLVIQSCGNLVGSMGGLTFV